MDVRRDELRRLRALLGLNQASMGALLGVGERSILRAEADDEGPWNDSTVRLVWLLSQLRLEDVEGALRHLLLDRLTPAEEAERPERLELLAGIMERLKGRVPPAQWPLLRLGDARNSAWVYWATQARADAPETLALARQEGLICRPLLDPERPRTAGARPATDYPWLELLAPGDRVLLCYDGEPKAWFRLAAVEVAVTPLPFTLPPVFRFVPAGTPLGKRLARSHYRQWHGRTTRADPPVFSCLAVTGLEAPLVRPRPRGRGVRDAMTAFVPAD